ncbi:42153_t:CDS:2 [Gigaspora margarita]|uniref:42153_t:CDS:1 n=1 Tax=Gigaspora margarita TaxID=4874 RepID=A0ABN7UYQ9_GIGMA|nr:42153_t:CDS:2 [Gigaspora margarita]
MATKNTLRQHRNREKESPKKRRECLSNNQNRKLKNKAAETAEECEVRLARDHERKHQKAGKSTALPQETDENGQSEDNVVSVSQAGDNAMDTNEELLSATTISEYEHELLQKFRTIVLIRGMRRRCSTEKTLPKKFSAENNMDPGKIPNELQGLTEVEEMLIAQVFTVMSVYNLCRGQQGYRGNVINFSQDIQELTTCLP